MRRFIEAGIDADIIAWPQETGCDYMISNKHGSVAIQRKVAVSELVSELDETMFDTLRRLQNFSDNPVLLVEENFGIDKEGFLFNRGDCRESQMLATSYYGYLETVRKMGIDVVTTRDINYSIWWMISMHGYLAKEHYPKHRKFHTLQEQAVGMLMAVAGIGEARAKKALKESSIRGMCGMKQIKGLTEKQSERVGEVLKVKL